jgi:hypothetical protein
MTTTTASDYHYYRLPAECYSRETHVWNVPADAPRITNPAAVCITAPTRAMARGAAFTTADAEKPYYVSTLPGIPETGQTFVLVTRTVKYRRTPGMPPEAAGIEVRVIGTATVVESPWLTGKRSRPEETFRVTTDAFGGRTFDIDYRVTGRR